MGTAGKPDQQTHQQQNRQDVSDQEQGDIRIRLLRDDVCPIFPQGEDQRVVAFGQQCRAEVTDLRCLIVIEIGGRHEFTERPSRRLLNDFNLFDIAGFCLREQLSVADAHFRAADTAKGAGKTQ